MMDKAMYEKIEQCHFDFARTRGKDRTYCPSEVARSVFSDDWREQMDYVRKVADDLWENRELLVLQSNIEINLKPSQIKGPIRLQIGPKFDI